MVGGTAAGTICFFVKIEKLGSRFQFSGIRVAANHEESLIGGFDHNLSLAHHVGKELDDFIAFVVEGAGNLTDCAWLVFYHR